MNSIKVAILTAVLVSSPTVFAQSKTVIAKPANVFTPKGFDSNDNAQIILSGAFGNFCHKIAPPVFKVDRKLRQILVQNQAYVSEGCADNQMMFVPYTTVINLGKVPAGNYDVMVKTAEGKFEKREHLPVAEAIIRNTSDELLYAPIDEISFKYRNGRPWPFLIVKGILTNTCLKLRAVKVKPTEGNIMEVLPIAIMDTENCKSAPREFSREVELVNFPKERTLIHVRTMNGQSLNKVITSVDRIIRR